MKLRTGVAGCLILDIWSEQHQRAQRGPIQLLAKCLLHLSLYPRALLSVPQSHLHLFPLSDLLIVPNAIFLVSLSFGSLICPKHFHTHKATSLD